MRTHEIDAERRAPSAERLVVVLLLLLLTTFAPVRGQPSPPPGVAVSFSQSSSNYSENAGAVQITVTLSDVSDAPVTVDFASNPADPPPPGNPGLQPAVPGTNYTAVSGTLTFNPGQISQTLTIQLLDDQTVDPTLFVALDLLNPNGATLGSTSRHTEHPGL